MQERAEEHDPPRPPVHKVELLITVSGAEEERNNRVLGCEEEDDRELCERDEACTINNRSKAAKVDG